MAADQPLAIHSLAELKQHPEAMPAQLVLKSDTRLVITSNGKEVGAIVSPAGATVDLISIEENSVQIGVGSARASVAPDATDLWQRINPAVGTSVPAGSTNASATPAPPAAPAAAPSPATPPAIPASTAPPLVYDVDIAPTGRYTKAAFRFWSPAYDQPIRGVIVLVPGLAQDGRGMIDDPRWQKLAQKYRLALVSCFMQGGGYYEAPRGTGDALLAALFNFAHQANRPEVGTVPLLLYGESAGGQFDYDFVLWKSDRIMAFVVNKGGYYDEGTPDSEVRSVPGLFFLGMSDSDLRIRAITDIWTEGRKGGALWALAPQPNSGHEFSKTAGVAQIFFDSVLKARLPDDLGGSDQSSHMKKVEEGTGWLGDLTTHAIQAESTDSPGDTKSAWLPDQSSAEAWKAFVSGE